MDAVPTPREYIRNNEPSSQRLRLLVQLGFLGLNVWIGFLFWRFVSQLEAGIEPTLGRPAGVEGYLPISALVSLKYYFDSGEWPLVHPASLVLLLLFVAIALLLKKGFCSWFCPVGFLSEYLARLRRFIFRKPFKGVHPAVDWPLRMLKYILLYLFVQAIFSAETAKTAAFIAGDYNKVADIKMMYFFTNLSATAAVVLAVLVVLSILIPYFWCRYLCPYGGLLGIVSIFSPVTIQRNAQSCIDCRACSKACPVLLPVHRMNQVSADECHACYKCVDACPVQDTLHLRVTGVKKKVPGKVYALVIVLFFMLATGAAQLFGYWNSSVTTAEYLELMPRLEELSHDRGL